VEKKLVVACTATTFSGSPAPRRVKPSPVKPANDSKLFDWVRQSRKSGYETSQVPIASGSGTSRERTSPRLMRRSGCAYGSGRSKAACTTEKMAVLDPIPSARVRVTTAANTGDCRSVRTVQRKS
jgi:hypothetical protein